MSVVGWASARLIRCLIYRIFCRAKPGLHRILLICIHYKKIGFAHPQRFQTALIFRRPRPICRRVPQQQHKETHETHRPPSSSAPSRWPPATTADRPSWKNKSNSSNSKSTSCRRRHPPPPTKTVYQLNPEAVNETLSPEAQEKGKNGETVTGSDGQQYVYDRSTGSWLLQSLIGSAAGAFIGNALANRFSRAAVSPATQPGAEPLRAGI